MPKEKKEKTVPEKFEKTTLFSGKEYLATLSELKKTIQECQIKAVTAVNKELTKLYWTIGETLADKQKKSGWGMSVIEKLAKDLQTAFPGIEGFSRSNIFRMKAFFIAYEKVAQAVRLFESLPIFSIPWGHNVILLQKIKNNEERLWYASKVVEHGWSRTTLEMWLESDLYHREGKAITNFQETLPKPQSDLAQQTLKDPYIFDFLTLHGDHAEKDLEEGLVNHIQKFLIELGQGFSFMGSQYPIEVDGDTSYIDLLFYHVKLRCFVVIELKARAFKPEDAGQGV